MGSFLTDRRVLLILVATVAALFADVFLLGTNFYARDVTRFYVPAAAVLKDAYANGGLPLWNARWGSGQPLAANPGYAAFYPGRLLLLLLPFATAFKIEVIAQYAIAAIGMYVLVRSLGARSGAALFGAVSYAFGGLMASFSNLVPFLESAALLPWVTYFVRRLLDRRRGVDGAGAVFTLALLLLAADQSMILQTGALMVAYAWWRGRRERGGGAARSVALVAAVIVAATLVASVQIIPALDLQRDTPRAHAMSYDHVTLMSMSLVRPIELVFPDFFGRFASAPPQYWGRRFVDGFPLPFALSLYPGLAAVLLLGAAFVRRMRGWSFAAGVAIVSYLVAAGRNAFAFPILYAAGLRSLRYPEKFISAGVFVGTLFAAVACERLFDDAVLRRIVVRFAIGVGAIATSMFVIAGSAAYPALFSAIFGTTEPAALFASRLGWAIAAVTALSLALILGLPMRQELRAPFFALFVAVDVLSRFGALAPRIDADYFDPPPAAAALRAAAQPQRIYNEFEWRRLLGRSAQPQLPPSARQWNVRNALLPETPSIWNLESALEPDITESFLQTTTNFTRLFVSLRAAGRDDRADLLLRMAGITRVAAEQRVDTTSLRSEADLRNFMPIRLVPLASSRYSFADSLVRAAEVTTLRDILLSRMSLSPGVAFVPIAPFLPAPGRVLASKERATTIDLDVLASGRAFLTIAITGHRYWRATIDGQPATIVPANLAFQGLVVPAGRHHITFRYANPVVSISLIITIVASVAVALLALVSSRARSGPVLPRDLVAEDGGRSGNIE